MINKKLGNDFEQELCEIFADAGYWVHNFANRKNGQPADVIAVKGGLAWLIDAKECTRDVFLLRRMEENQRLAMSAWLAKGNMSPYFALKFKDGDIYMMSFEILAELEKQGIKQISRDEAERYGTILDMWLRARG